MNYSKPTIAELEKIQKNRISQNTIKCTNKWVKIINAWQNHVNVGYNYTLESVTSKSQLEKEVCEFICEVRTLKGDYYSQSSLKNAVASISRYLRDAKSDWQYNLLNKSDFPNIFATLDGILKEMKKLGIGTTKSYDGITTEELKLILYHEELSPNNPEDFLHRVFLWMCLFGCLHGNEHKNLLVSQFIDTNQEFIFQKFKQKNDQGGIEGNQYDLEIPFPKDIPNQAEPNADIHKFISLRPPN
ncbi:18768_t:CDS:1, partial [Acaulospora morrowiae]